MKHAGKCRHLHGHSVKAAITVSAAALNEEGMVCDFSEISAIAHRYIDEVLDHNLLLHREDPIIPTLIENGERFLALEEHPTAEYLAKLIFDQVKARGFDVKRVTLWETTSASASFCAD